ncbi:hypothetical protein BLNAU_7429 [Blattamonas nauphoetae]|uniref:Uncharacterized protein n=1 Tax=Blattamonas nauphoetae TaxID=2049346 RepID=A0ABQ9Y1A9_9EUKA|nr:hypothetical protein BLNAU_7429 [Blattamonas nauphoetae]
MPQSHTSAPIRFQTRTVSSASPKSSSSLSPPHIHPPQRRVRCHPTHADIPNNVMIMPTSTAIKCLVTNTTASRADPVSGVGRTVPKVVSRQLARIRQSSSFFHFIAASISPTSTLAIHRFPSSPIDGGSVGHCRASQVGRVVSVDWDDEK